LALAGGTISLAFAGGTTAGVGGVTVVYPPLAVSPATSGAGAGIPAPPLAG